MRLFANFIMGLLIPIANTFLSAGFLLNEDFYGIFKIKEAIFQAMNGYVQIGIVPQFI